jgi:nucleoside phosphorylase
MEKQSEVSGPYPILIVAVTKMEVQAIRDVFSVVIPWTPHEINKKTYYDLGVHCGTPIFMVQCEMGIATPGGALLTIRKAIQDLNPQAVIMYGVAYGLRPNEQQLGDILISKQIEYYEPQKVVAQGQISQGDRVTVSEHLLDRFRAADNDWDSTRTQFGLILSGEKQGNDPDFGDRLIKAAPGAIGVETEGAGLYTAARETKVDWIIVKSICNWANGEKDDDAQVSSAANNAAQFILHTLHPGERINEKYNRPLWLKALGFKTDPFTYQNGSQDPSILTYFYQIPDFFGILGDPAKLWPVFVLGAEGSGRSSLRNAIAQMSKQYSVLPVVYNSLNALAEISQNRPVQLSDHIFQIICEILSSLKESLQSRDKQIRTTNEKDDPFLRDFIWSYVIRFVSNPLTRRGLGELLNPKTPDIAPVPETQNQPDLLDNLVMAICEVFQYQAIYILVDPGPIAPPVSTSVLWDILQPLLAAPQLLNPGKTTTRYAVKLFLDESLKEKITSIPWIASNTLQMVYILSWTQETLKKLLRERLRLSSNKRPPMESLGQISKVSELDEILVKHSAGSPRQLIALCNRLFSVHFNQPYNGKNQLITEEEVTQVINEFKPGPSQMDAAKILEGSRNLDAYTLQQLIWQGESEYVEFKSTLRLNLFTGNSDSKLEQVVAQEICSFLNTRGGFVLIGIDDNGNALGLENDYKTLSMDKRNEDGFRLAITNILANYFDLPPEGVRILFVSNAGKQVCVILVPKSREPAYCIIDQRAEFFVRIENSARKLDVRKAVRYIKGNFEQF